MERAGDGDGDSEGVINTKYAVEGAAACSKRQCLPPPPRTCAKCGEEKPKAQYSNTQWAKKQGARKCCVRKVPGSVGGPQARD